MLGSVRGTPYDMRFSLFGVPVAVTPMFWLAAALIGWPWLTGPGGHPILLITWMLCVFVSILVHEFGHALAARFFGHRPNMLLYHFGGLTFYGGRDTPGRAFLITAAGPAVQLALGAAMVITHLTLQSTGRLPEEGTPAATAVFSMASINIVWPLFNLLPVLPLDGGRLVESGLAFAGLRTATLWTVRLSVVIAVPLAIAFVWLALNGYGTLFLAILFVLLAVENYRALQGPRSDDPY